MTELEKLILEQAADDACDVCVPEKIIDPLAKKSEHRFAHIKNFTSCKSKFDPASQIPTPEEISIAKIDGICPRCERPIEFFNGDALCACGFSV